MPREPRPTKQWVNLSPEQRREGYENLALLLMSDEFKDRVFDSSEVVKAFHEKIQIEPGHSIPFNGPDARARLSQLAMEAVRAARPVHHKSQVHDKDSLVRLMATTGAFYRTGEGLKSTLYVWDTSARWYFHADSGEARLWNNRFPHNPSTNIYDTAVEGRQFSNNHKERQRKPGIHPVSKLPEGLGDLSADALPRPPKVDRREAAIEHDAAARTAAVAAAAAAAPLTALDTLERPMAAPDIEMTTSEDTVGPEFLHFETGIGKSILIRMPDGRIIEALVQRVFQGDAVKALDLFCCGGGASRGLADAGFQVTGVDIEDRSSHYPYDFLCSDATTLKPEWIANHFDFVWASPPCQRFSNMTKYHGTPDDHPDLVEPTRDLLRRAGLPFVLENVVGAPLRPDLLLCGKMLGLDIARHRIFELEGFRVQQPWHQEHAGRVITVTGHPGGTSTRDGPDRFGSTEVWKEVMGIDWLPADLLREAIPPLYSRFIVESWLGPSRRNLDPRDLLVTEAPSLSLLDLL